MTIGEVAATVFLASGLFAWWRIYHATFWLVAGLGALTADLVTLYRYGLFPVVIAGPISASVMLGATLLGLLLWAQVLGLPRGLALTLGIGLTSRPLRFHNRLVEIQKPLAEAVVRAQRDPDRRAAALAIADHQIERLRSLRPPDGAWAALRDDIADHDATGVALLRAGASAERIADHAAAFALVMARWDEMRDRAAADQRLLATPARRRRGEAVWLAAIGISLLFIGLAQARIVDVPSLTIADGRFWLIAGAFVGGVAALLGSLVVVLRRP